MYQTGMRWLLLAVLMLVFSVMAVGQSGGAQLTDLTSSHPRNATQNNVITFTAEVEGPPSELFFKWEFGEISPGQERTLQGFGLERVRVHYVLKENTAIGNFSIIAMVEDSQGGADSRTIRQAVNRGTAAVEFVSPPPGQNLAAVQGAGASFAFRVVNDKREVVLPSEVLQSSASLNGAEIPLAVEGDTFAGTFDTTELTETVSYLEVEVEIPGSVGTFKARGVHPVVLAFPTLAVDESGINEARFYLGAPMQDVVVSLTRNGEPAAGVHLNAVLVRGETSMPAVVHEETEGYRIVLDHVPVLEDVDNGLVLELNGADSAGNALPPRQRFELNLSQQNPDFDFKLLRPDVRNRTYGINQNILLEGSVFSQNTPVEDAVVTFQDLESGEEGELLFDTETQTYQATLQYPEGTEGVRSIRFVASSSGEKPLMDVADLDIRLTDELNLKILYPPVEAVAPDKGNTIEVEITYPNRETFEQARIPATIKVDDKSEAISLVHRANGVYRAEVEIDLRGEHALTVSLAAPLNGRVTTKGALEGGELLSPFLAGLLGLLVLAVMAFFGYRAIKEMQAGVGEEKISKELRERMARLDKESEKLGFKTAPGKAKAPAMKVPSKEEITAPTRPLVKPPATPKHKLLSERVASWRKTLAGEEQKLETPSSDKSAAPAPVPPPAKKVEGAVVAGEMPAELALIKREIANLDTSYKQGDISVHEYNARLHNIQKRLQSLQKP